MTQLAETLALLFRLSALHSVRAELRPRRLQLRRIGAPRYLWRRAMGNEAAAMTAAAASLRRHWRQPGAIEARSHASRRLHRCWDFATVVQTHEALDALKSALTLVPAAIFSAAILGLLLIYRPMARHVASHR